MEATVPEELDGIRPVARSDLRRLLSQLAKGERLLDGAGECRRPLERLLEPGPEVAMR